MNSIDVGFSFLFTACYETLGTRQSRPRRRIITRPSLSETLGYCKHVDAAVDTPLSSHVTRNADELAELGFHIGTVDAVADGRIRRAKRDSGEGAHKDHNHFIDLGLVAAVEDWIVRLLANVIVAVTFEEEQFGKPV